MELLIIKLREYMLSTIEAYEQLTTKIIREFVCKENKNGVIYCRATIMHTIFTVTYTKLCQWAIKQESTLIDRQEINVVEVDFAWVRSCVSSH